MRNSYELQEVTNRQKFPKNNYFCYRWRVLDNFNKSIERRMFQLQVQGAGNNVTLLSDRILQLYKARHHDGRKDLIVDLAQDAMGFLHRRRQEHQMNSKIEVMLSKATASLMDRTFNTFLAFSTELNSLLGLSELFITATEPEVTKRSNQSATSIATCVQCHIATSLFRLVMEGRGDKISFYMIQSDNILALSDITRFEPIAVWQAQFAAEDRIYWVCSSGVMTEGMLDVACAELIRNLVETTQEAISPKHTYKKTDLQNFELEESDPWLQETPVHTISSEGTRTDSVPSLATLYKESGIFEAVEGELETEFPTDLQSEFQTEIETEFQTPVQVLRSIKRSEALSTQNFNQVQPPQTCGVETEIDANSVWQPVFPEQSEILAPPDTVLQSFESAKGEIVCFNKNSENEIAKASSFDLKKEYYSDTVKMSGTKSKKRGTPKKNRKKRK